MSYAAFPQGVFAGLGEVPAKNALPPRAACREAVLRGLYPTNSDCIKAWQAGAVIPAVEVLPIPPPAFTSTPLAKYLGIGIASVVVIGGGYLLFRKDRSSLAPNRRRR